MLTRKVFINIVSSITMLVVIIIISAIPDDYFKTYLLAKGVKFFLMLLAATINGLIQTRKERTNE